MFRNKFIIYCVWCLLLLCLFAITNYFLSENKLIYEILLAPYHHSSTSTSSSSVKNKYQKSSRLPPAIDQSDFEWHSLNILSEQRQILKHQLVGTPPSEKTSQPIRSLIITTWRSGSTFLGDILNSMHGNFYHYEPLLQYKIQQIRGPPHDQQAVKIIDQLLRCNYTNLREYFKMATYTELFSQNLRYWQKCQPLCFEKDFIEKFCSLFPLQSMKIVRLRLALVENLLADLR